MTFDCFFLVFCVFLSVCVQMADVDAKAPKYDQWFVLTGEAEGKRLAQCCMLTGVESLESQPEAKQHAIVFGAVQEGGKSLCLVIESKEVLDVWNRAVSIAGAFDVGPATVDGEPEFAIKRPDGTLLCCKADFVNHGEYPCVKILGGPRPAPRGTQFG